MIQNNIIKEAERLSSEKTAHPTRIRRRKQSGMMLVTMLGLMTCLVVLMASAAFLATSLVQSTKLRMDKADANNMADSGVDLAIAWLQSRASPPDDATLHPLNNFWGAPKDAQGRAVISAPFGRTGTTLTIGIYSDNANPNATQKHYVIESKATTANGTSTIVRAYAQQVSFGKYAFFADIDSGGFWDWNNHFEGPFHSNCSDGKPSTFLWKPSPPDGPIFQYQGGGALETTITPKWWKNAINATAAPSTDSEWKDVAAGGLASISISSNNFITMPSTDYLQEYIALGQTPPSTVTSPPTSGVPTRTGVSVSADGGIFVHGAVTQMVLSANGPGVQKFSIVTKPSGYTLTQTVTVDETSTTVQSILTDSNNKVIPATTSPANQYPNTTTLTSSKGLVYCDDNIASLSGTVADNKVDSTTGAITYRNQWSVFTDTAAGKDITITDSLVYATQRNFTKSQDQDSDYNTNAGTLGIVANDVNVATKKLDGTALPQVNVNADIFCTGTYQAQDYKAVIGSNASMTEVGGVIVKTSGLFATINNSGTLASGRSESYHYDTRLADHPPPYFPTTGSHYVVTSNQIVLSTLQ